MKILLWDIEATNLSADMGYLLCVGYKWYGQKKTHVVSIQETAEFRKDPCDDSGLLRRVFPVLASADFWVTWYGRRYDERFLKSRALVHDTPPLPPIKHVDLWETAKFRLALHSNRLQSVTEAFGFEDKTRLRGDIWMHASAGQARGLKYVVEHCRQDVKVLEQVYTRLRPVAHGHPNLALLVETPRGEAPTARCPFCGARDTLNHGPTRVARVSRTQLFQCAKCGGWSEGPPQRDKSIFAR